MHLLSSIESLEIELGLSSCGEAKTYQAGDKMLCTWQPCVVAAFKAVCVFSVNTGNAD
jgi:hypothetical protein